MDLFAVHNDMRTLKGTFARKALQEREKARYQEPLDKETHLFVSSYFIRI